MGTVFAVDVLSSGESGKSQWLQNPEAVTAEALARSLQCPLHLQSAPAKGPGSSAAAADTGEENTQDEHYPQGFSGKAEHRLGA